MGGVTTVDGDDTTLSLKSRSDSVQQILSFKKKQEVRRF